MSEGEKEVLAERLQEIGLPPDVGYFSLQLQRMNILHPSVIKPEDLERHLRTFHTMYQPHFDPHDEDLD